MKAAFLTLYWKSSTLLAFQGHSKLTEVVVLEWQSLLEESELPFLFQDFSFLFGCEETKAAHACVGEWAQMGNSKAALQGNTNIE